VNRSSTARVEQPILIKPVEKVPTRKFYCYTKRICSVCGAVHTYRKVGISEDKIVYGCTDQYQLGFLPEDNVYQVSLFERE
jgi:hypothetical protein